MKNLTTIIFGVCAAALALTACQQKPDKPEFASISKTETFRDGEGTFELDYRFEYLSWYSDEAVASIIRGAMITDFFGEEYADMDPEESSVAFDLAMADQYVTGETDTYKWSGFMKIRSHHDVVGERLVAYTVEQEEYMGGAHGMETVKYYNYDLRTGDRLTLDDVFTTIGKNQLADKIQMKILKDHQKVNWDELGEEGCYFALDKVQPTENFLLSKEHITFMYNPYEIACFAQGRTKVTLPLNGLEGFNKDILVK